MPHSKVPCFGLMHSVQRHGMHLPGEPAINGLKVVRPALSNGALEPAQRIEAVQPAVLLLHVIKCIRKANQ